MLCQTAIVYDRRIGDETLSFGHEGILYRRSFIMYDKQKGSLWVHTTGEAINGPYKGKVLKFLPCSVMPWKRWKERHPDTTVLTGQRGAPHMGRYGLAEDPEKYGLSVGQSEAPKLYPIALLAKQRVVNDTLDGTPIVVLWDDVSKSGKAYERGERTFAWRDGKIVDQSGMTWDVLRGLSEQRKATRLKERVSTPWLIQRWKGFYPKGTIHAAK